MKKALSGIFLLFMGCTGLLSCGSNSPSSTAHVPSGLKFRAFVSNPLSVSSSGGTGAALDILDASHDLLSFSTVDLSVSVTDAGMMALSPSKALTLVASPSTNFVAIVDNTNESARSTISLPGTTQSFFVWTDNQTGFAAIPTAPVTSGQGASPGAVVVLGLPAAAVSATIPVAGARYVVDSHDGNRILAFGSSPQTVTVIAPSQIGTSTDPRTTVSSPAFDHPVWGVFSADDTTAYIMNCGAECGGTAASVAVLNMNLNPPQVTASIPVPAATYGLLNGSTLYVAGTSSAGGALSVISLSSNTVVKANPITISDGYHNRMAISTNNELFIGARTCTGGCLSIFNISSAAVVMPPAAGNVTGIQPITGRNVVYVCQNGALNIYDSTKNSLQATQVDVVGQAVDVELVDSP
ncbi:MAG: YncE family protein [Terriglobales bacterium]